MATTSPWNIPLFDDSMPVAPLQSLFNGQSSALNAALSSLNTGFKTQAATPVASVGERAVIFPAPVQGNAVYRTDLGYEERYFATYDSNSNVAGATPAGWYPLANAGPYYYGQKTIDQQLPNGQGAQITFNNNNALGMSATTGGNVTVPITGWYRVTASLGGFSSGAGNNRWLYVTKNSDTDQPRILSVVTNFAAPGDNIWNASKVVLLAAGDVLRMNGLQDSGATANLNGSTLAVEWAGHAHG